MLKLIYSQNNGGVQVPINLVSMYSTLTSAPIRPNSRGIKKSHTTDMASPMAFYMRKKWSLSEI